MERRRRTRGRRSAELYGDVLDNFRLFADMGLRIIAGSNAGFLVTRFDKLQLGLRIMIEQGLSGRRAIRATTVETAAALGLHSTTGCIRTRSRGRSSGR